MARIAEQITEGTISYPDGTMARWNFVEHVPYDPSCYQNDEGIIVWVDSYPGSLHQGNEYYISFSDASVWRMQDDEESVQIEGAVCPEVKKGIDDFIAMMGS